MKQKHALLILLLSQAPDKFAKISLINPSWCIKYLFLKGASLWNDLPPFIKNITSINKFNTTTKSYLLTLNI